MRGSYNSDPYCVKRVRVLVIQSALLQKRRGSDGKEPRHREDPRSLQAGGFKKSDPRALDDYKGQTH